MKNKTLWALGLVLVVALVAVAGINKEGYDTLHATPSVYRGSALDGDDSKDWSSPLSTSGSTRSVTPTYGNPTINMSALLSKEGATTCLSVGLYNYSGGSYHFLGVAAVTTVTGGEGASGVYPAPITFSDSVQATHYEVRITDPSSSATVTIYTWAGGSDTKGG